jgi:hypothetical protein
MSASKATCGGVAASPSAFACGLLGDANLQLARRDQRKALVNELIIGLPDHSCRRKRNMLALQKGSDIIGSYR